MIISDIDREIKNQKRKQGIECIKGEQPKSKNRSKKPHKKWAAFTMYEIKVCYVSNIKTNFK